MMQSKIKAKAKGSKEPRYLEAIVPAEENDLGSIRIETGAIAAIVRKTVCQVEGVTRISGNSIVDNIAEFVGSRKIQDRAIQIRIDEDSISVEVAINVAYGFTLPEVAAEVQQSVSTQIEDLTGLSVSQVNVIIREMEDPDEKEENQEE